MSGFLKLLSVFAVAGLCWTAYHHVEDLQSTERKATIIRLEWKVEDLFSKIEDLRTKIIGLETSQRVTRAKILTYIPDAQLCTVPSEGIVGPPPPCDGDMVCDASLGICVAPPENEEVPGEEETA